MSTLDERHYMRAYVKQERELIKFSVSEKIIKGDHSFFTEMADDYLQGLRQHQYQQEYEDDESEEDDYENEEEDGENSRGEMEEEEGIKENLYGDNADDGSRKNIIVDEDYEEFD